LYWIGLGRLTPQLVLDGVEDLVDGEPERGEVLCRLEIWSGLGERIGSACLL